MKKELCRINDGKMVEGVCGGFAKYIGIDVSIVRFIWLLLCLAGGIGIWLYIISTITMPKEQIKNHHQRARRIRRRDDVGMECRRYIYWRFEFHMDKNKEKILDKLKLHFVKGMEENMNGFIG